MDLSHMEQVLQVLDSKGIDGATITEIIKETSLTRDNVRIALAALEGGEKIQYRQVGKAKLYRSMKTIKEVGL